MEKLATRPSPDPDATCAIHHHGAARLSAGCLECPASSIKTRCHTLSVVNTSRDQIGGPQHICSLTKQSGGQYVKVMQESEAEGTLPTDNKSSQFVIASPLFFSTPNRAAKLNPVHALGRSCPHA
jgi:hypothetical protein